MRLPGLWLLIAISAVACSRQSAPATPAAVAPNAAIAWREGGVEEAFAEAAETQQPVLLYWGAKWCPPCNQLAATVFQRPAFIAQTRHFIAVHLDGDTPGAQQWGEYFGIVGYPTLLILRADRSELTRISGDSDVEQYPLRLQLALQQTQPIADLLKLALANVQRLREPDWAALAWYGWDIDEQRLVTAQRRITVLDQLTQQCPQPELQQRFALLALSGRVGDAVALSPAQRDAAATLLLSALRDEARVRSNLVLLEGSAADWLPAIAAIGSSRYQELAQALLQAMDRVAADTQLSPGERLDSRFAELAIWQQQHGKQAPPAAMLADIRSRVRWADQQAKTPYERQNLMHSAAQLLAEAGLRSEARTLLLAELPQSRAPYYHMLTLARLAEDEGDSAQAVAWLRKAYAAAEGPATRAQWGVTYVNGLIRLQPENRETITAAVTQLIDELAASRDGYYQRTRKRFETLSARLLEWAQAQHGDAQIAQLHTQMQTVCVGLPAAGEARASCERFLLKPASSG